MNEIQKLERAKQVLGVWKEPNQYPDVSEIVIEALEHFIWELENFLKLDAEQTKAEELEGVETIESKVSAELLNQ